MSSEKWTLCAIHHGPQGARKGYKDQWRVRVGDWRVVYIIDDAAKLISITRLAHRREVYER
ncbi:MAG: type II toxin-antitoxin system RelE/ParE family toxin [Terriglobia bacterium]